ncbi:hypothetical protein MKK63_26010 [Methylobacterium sp. J-088]|uniref:hypothetical protein n=1 Tax=unclassified Methylobacterium TaxID=2615210 RepID=UPI001FB93A98|nr:MULTISPECIES: hypothetical protein [unclassified Methylobacterium]MCJ2066130.1 hypothetical protein [Methylobacterium sp. J-088]
MSPVIPEQRRRGLGREEHKGTILRDNLGLPRFDNRFSAPHGDRRVLGPDIV